MSTVLPAVLHVGKRITLSLVISPAGAQVSGVPVWTVSPTGGVTMFPSADGMSCDLLGATVLSSQTVTVSATPVGGTTPLTATQPVQTVAPVATGLSITVGPEH